MTVHGLTHLLTFNTQDFRPVSGDNGGHSGGYPDAIAGAGSGRRLGVATGCRMPGPVAAGGAASKHLSNLSSPRDAWKADYVGPTFRVARRTPYRRA